MAADVGVAAYVTISVEEAREQFRITMKAGNLSYMEVEWQLEDETACQAVIVVLVSDPILVMENRAILGSIEDDRFDSWIH